MRAVSSASASAPTMTVTSSASSSTSTSSSAIAASAADFVATQMPSRVIAIQSPAAIGPHSATLSRTACVTSPARTRAAASSIAAALSSSDAWGSYTTSAAERLDHRARSARPPTGRSVSSGTCARHRARCSCCWAARSRRRRRTASTASRICAVDGFIDCPPATTCCTPRLREAACASPSPTATATTPVATCSSSARAGRVGRPACSRTHASSSRSSTCSRRSVTRMSRGPPGDDAGLDGGADVVGVHVAVPDAVAADDDDRVAEIAPRAP